MTWKKGCGVGCLGLFTVGVVLMGAATWYAREINREYKAVQKSEDALLEAVVDQPFQPPALDSVPRERLAAFLAVRDSLQKQRVTLAAASAEFGRETDRQRGGGLRGVLNLVDSGSSLAPVYAKYWSRRNAALLAHRMGPQEYVWYYSLVYGKWLGKDEDDGRTRQTGPAAVWVSFPTELPPALLDLLAPRRMQAEANYDPQVNPVELMFAATVEE